MGQHILLAEPCELLRIGLRTILLADERVSQVSEASTQEHLKAKLQSCKIDLTIVNQVLIREVTQLPKGKFVILASNPDIGILKSASSHGARGYLSENVSAELLRVVLSSSDESFLLEPSLTPWIMKSLLGGTFFCIKEELLTPREKEIIQLLREGLDRRTIAKRLSISDATLKTHIKNIRKRDSEHYAEKVFGIDTANMA